ncbi:MAG: response regulator [Oscillospiraceae bacterium]|nr:response regulator [Oscillospiraceae bacterium]
MSKRVLVVDDSSLMRRMMKNILTRNGYIIAGEANSGKLGVELFEKLRPDIVTMDIVMDNMNGLEALSHIKSIAPDACVIMVSSMGQEVIVRDAIKNGADDFLLKPYDEDDLLKAFKKLNLSV